MTIQRKYQLPNCTLLLEGLSENINASQSPEVRPVMSLLVSAECKLANSKQILSGGRDFFESLVTVVSGYAQEFLSGVPHAEAHNKESGLVQLQKIDANRHRLIVQPEKLESEHGGANVTPVATQIDLTTVQLFDLVEAVDQFFADSRTLPDLSLELSPVSKRFTRSGQQLVQQAVPATVGASSLALAAIAFFLVPVPEVRPPQPQPQSRSAQSTSLATAPAITDPPQLVALNQKLYDQLKPAWKPQPGVKDLIYRVGVAADGKIKGYVAINDAANTQAQQTPLPSLLAKPTTTSKTTPEPLAQFRVVFANNDVQVQPWSDKK